MSNEIIPKKVLLPEITDAIPHIQAIIGSLNLPSSVIAEENEILWAWKELPAELTKVQPELRNELLARMCVATSVGLFDSAINYIWNATVSSLRKKVIDFGVNVVKQILGKEFDETILKDYKDAELLTSRLS